MPIPAGSAAFLQQAHRNNWQRYIASLNDDARRGWDLCVLTASDERQAEMVRKQLAWRREAHLLPAGTEFVVLPDPDGRRIGSGGATLRALALRTEQNPYPTGRRTLIIHSGGDSKRLPHCSAQGKLFARIPRTLPDGRASTIFDEFLITLSGLAPVLPPGALVASGDVLLVFDHLQLTFRRQGVTGVAAAAPAEMGQRHGVFVSQPGGHRVRAYLHKPDLAELAQWDAIADDQVQIDTGLVWLDGSMLDRLAVLTANEAVASAPLNLYGDLLLPLAESTGFDDYLADTSDGPATPGVQAARRVIWDLLRGAPLTVEQLQPAVFVHFGSSAEYWRMVAADAPLATLCGWESQTASWSGSAQPVALQPGEPGKSRGGLVLINAAVEGEIRGAAEAGLLVADSRLAGPLSWSDPGVISGVETGQALAMGRNLVLDQLPAGAAGFVTRCFGLYDDPKRACDNPAATYCNIPWAEWLRAADLAPEDVWPGVEAGQRSLWNARLFPLLPDREESLRLALPLSGPGAAPPGWREQWLATPRLSLAESAVKADGDRLLGQLMAIEDQVAARRFAQALTGEAPAAEAKTLLGASVATRARRALMCDSQACHADPVVRMRVYRGLSEATGDPGWEDRAFGLLAGLIEAATLTTGRIRRATRPWRDVADVAIRVEAAARIDLGGGWTDTPPYSIERGGTVLNAAITLRGEHPISAEVCWLDEPRLILQSRDLEMSTEPKCAGDVLAYANPADPFALPKAALVLRGIVPQDAQPGEPLVNLLRETGGLRLTTGARTPLGSGLGTSSILAGAVLLALSEVTGEAAAGQGQLFDEVLCLEQMLTTGGGWQDQVGGLTGGIKLVTSGPGLPQRITVAPVKLAPETQAGLAQRLCLVYTGQQRLAKNLLRNVMSRWMAREPEMVWIQAEIARLALAMRGCLLAGDLDGFGTLLGEHWTLNKAMDPGCTNPFIDDLYVTMRPYILGGKLAGAGGGGFASVVVRSPDHAQGLAAALAEKYPGTRVGIWPCAIPEEGVVKRPSTNPGRD